MTSEFLAIQMVKSPFEKTIENSGIKSGHCEEGLVRGGLYLLLDRDCGVPHWT